MTVVGTKGVHAARRRIWQRTETRLRLESGLSLYEVTWYVCVCMRASGATHKHTLLIG